MKTKIWLALLALYLVWGSTYLAIRFAVETIPPFLSAGLRFLVSGAILLTWRRLAGDPLPTRRQWRSTAIVGILLLLGGNGLVSFAEQSIPSGIAALIIGSVPLWMVGIEAVRSNGVKPNWQATLGLLIGFGGIFLLTGPSELTDNGHTFDPLGISLLLAAAFLWSVGSIYSRNADMPKSSLMATGAEMLAGSIALFLVSGLTGEWHGFSFTQATASSWLGLAYLITFGSLVGFVSYGWLLQNAPVSLVATYAYVNPLVAVFLGAWLADEIINARILMAGLVIIGSVALINQAKSSQPNVIEKKAVQAASTD
ncbi:MAG: drug/metabolite exporter YedA [Anaerolineales bacterium]